MGNVNDRVKLLHEVLDQRIVVLDGAMGTMIQQRDLSAADFGGPALEGCNENLVLTRPDVILDIHRKYYEAGADIVETDTFGATPLVLAEYGLADKCREINATAAKLARQAAEEFSTPTKPRFVAASIGPTTKAITVTGGVTFDQLIENFYQQVRGLAEGGADILLVETCQDTRNIKAALIGIQKAFDELGYKLPIMVSGTIEPMGTMLAGQAADALVASLQHVDLLSVGLNCADRSRIHDRSHSHHSSDGDDARVVLSERGFAERGRTVSRNADLARVVVGAVRQERLGQHHRRLLRHDTGPHQSHRADGRRDANRASSARRASRITPASNWSRRPTTTVRSSLANGRTKSARARSSGSSRKRSSRKRRRSPGRRSRAARTSSTSTSKTPTATNWPTSTGFTRR